MTKAAQAPWAAGPGEILRHGLELLKRDTDTNRRLAMISIDNAVELTIKTYLGLPTRITGLKISRNEYQDFSESFPKLLDALEKHASDKLNGVDLGDIEWYHRLRNQLYHQGNGLTVERDKVEVYAELANALFTNLFGFRLVQPEDDKTALLGNFMIAWVNFEKVLAQAAASLNIDTRGRPVMPLQITQILEKEGYISRAEMVELTSLRETRNKIVHGVANHQEALKPDTVKRLVTLTTEIEQRLQARP